MCVGFILHNPFGSFLSAEVADKGASCSGGLCDVDSCPWEPDRDHQRSCVWKCSETIDVTDIGSGNMLPGSEPPMLPQLRGGLRERILH